MLHVLKKAGIAALTLVGLATAATVGLGLILRYQPASLMKPARQFAGRVLNPPVLWYTNRFGRKSQPLVYHRGRKSGREPRSGPTWTGWPICEPLPNREWSTTEQIMKPSLR